MKRLADAVDLGAKLEAIDRRRRHWRVQRILEYGWPETIVCPNCGDVGTEPEPPHKPCFCAAGEPIRLAAEREATWQGLIPRRLRDWTLASHPRQEIAPAIRDWLAALWRDPETGRLEGPPLVLLGPVGTGKTGLAIGALRELYVRGSSVKFGTVPSLLDSIRPGPDSEEPRRAIRSLTSVDVLLLDDLGAHKATDWSAERLFMIANDRYTQERPSIVTSNCTLEEIEEAIGPRTISRLMDSATTLHVGGEDLRTASAREGRKGQRR